MPKIKEMRHTATVLTAHPSFLYDAYIIPHMQLDYNSIRGIIQGK